MALLVLTFGLAVLPGLALFYHRRGPRVTVKSPAGPPAESLPEVAVLRDGAVGATRWAFAALLVKCARDGHCTLVREQKRRWVRTAPALTVDLHADLQALSSFEQTALRQVGRHDTLAGFGFAGSTFRRRTLRDVRADLVERGWLADRSQRSNGCLALGLVLLSVGLLGAAGGLPVLGAAASAGLGTGALIAACVRYPVTEAGAQRRAAHRAYAERQRARIRDALPDAPERAAAVLREALPALVLERIATPRWLVAAADRFEAATVEGPPPDWFRDEVDGIASFPDACRALASVLRTMNACASLSGWRSRPGQPL
jgi:hypothetical protein